MMWFAGINQYMYVHEYIFVCVCVYVYVYVCVCVCACVCMCVCVQICRVHMCHVDPSIGCGSYEATCVEVYVDYRDKAFHILMLDQLPSTIEIECKYT